MGRFMPGARISQVAWHHGAGGSRDRCARRPVYALYHPAAALRSTDVERQSYDDVAGIPRVLRDARERRQAAGHDTTSAGVTAATTLAGAPTSATVGPSMTGAADGDAHGASTLF